MGSTVASPAGKRIRRLVGIVLAFLIVLGLPSTPAGSAPKQGKGGPAEGRGDSNHPSHSHSSNGKGRFVEGELLVRFEPTTSDAERVKVRRRHGLVKVDDVALAGLERVRFTGRGTPPERAKHVARESLVRYAEPNFLWQPASIPNDAEFTKMWGLHNTGQSSGTVDADIDAPEGWDVAADTSGVVVGVIDEGVQIGHPDLAANIWVNSGEIPANGIDDDGNNYVDDVNGWDFFNDDASVFDEAQGDAHGTHVAGTIAGVTNNSVGVAGVSDAKIMPLKFLGPPGGVTSDAIDALDYAITMGADLTNNSWGGGGASQALGEKIREAGDFGQLFIAAAGNGGPDGVGDDNDSAPHYPSSYTHPSVISVASTTRTDDISSFSNFGDVSVDLGAPGSSIVSTLPLVKAVLAEHSLGGKSAYHTFGLEGVVDTADRNELLSTALTWAGVGTADSILLVDDDAGAAYETFYTAALTAGSYTSTTHTVVAGNGPNSDTMFGHEAVIWFTGDDFSSTLTSADQSNLTTYLDGGGKLLLFGTDIGFDIIDSTGANTFLNTKLKAGFIVDVDEDYDLAGVPGGPYGSISLSLTPGGGAGGQFFSSGVHPMTGGTAALKASAPAAAFSGTSMATPHVAGVVAHVIAKFPNMRPADIKSRVMHLGDPIPALTTKTASGRRLNLANVLATGTITGTVSADAGGTLAGICVTAYSSPTGGYSRSTTTNGSGAYAITVPTGTYRLLFRDCSAPVEYANEWHSGGSDFTTATDVAVGSGASPTVNASLADAGTMSGLVTGTDTGMPVGGICVAAFTENDTWVARTVTDSLGTWELSGFATGSYEVRFNDCTRTGSSQYATHWYNGDAAHGSPTLVAVSAGLNTPAVNANLPRSGRISGTVTAAVGGAAIRSICVAAFTPDGYFIQRTHTTSIGTYELWGMGTGDFKVRFTDCVGFGYATEWYDNVADRVSATLVPVNASSTTSGINAALS